MTKKITPSNIFGTSINREDLPPPPSALRTLLEKAGRFPPVQLLIKPLDGSDDVILNRFLSYDFASSVLEPVDSWSFTFAAPDDPTPFSQRVKPGDIAILSANGIALSTGIIDMTTVKTDSQTGEEVTVTGRDLMAQFEDQDAISFRDKPIWGNRVTVRQAINALRESTRIPSDLILQDVPTGSYLFATEPGESKLSAFQRYLEPLNILAWMRGDGKMICGRPNFRRDDGIFVLSKDRRRANVLSIQVVRKPTTIPTHIVPVWQGQEFVTDRVSAQQRLLNPATDVTRLRKLKHILPKTVVVSNPQGNDPQALAQVTTIENATSTRNRPANAAGGSSILQAYAKREMARLNIEELTVELRIGGHYNENGIPYQVDQVYKVEYDRGDVDERMYLYQIDWKLDERSGQVSTLKFCRLGRITADALAV